MTSILYNVPEDEYHGEQYSKYVSSSKIRRVAEKGLGSYHKPESDPTDEMELGSAIHALALEPETFADKYVLFDDEAICKGILTKDGEPAKRPRATAEYTKAEKEFRSNHEGKVILDRDRWDRTARCAAAAASYLPDVNNYREIVILWPRRVRMGGYGDDLFVDCKARLDFVDVDNRVVYDIKTIRDIKLFQGQFADKHYHIQAAFYLEAIKEATGLDMSFRIIWVQSDGATGSSECMEVDTTSLVTGRGEIDDILVDICAMQQGKLVPKVLPRVPAEFKLKLPSWYRRYGVWK